MYSMQQQTATPYSAASNSAFVCRQAATSAHLNGLSSREHTQNVRWITWAGLHWSHAQRAAAARRLARLSFVTDTHSLLFGLQKEKSMGERERVQTAVCNRLLVLYEVFLLHLFYLPIAFYKW